MLRWRVVPAVRFCLLILTVLLAGGVRLSAQTASPAGLADLSRSLQELSARVSPSVVQIFVTGYVTPDDEDRAATGEPRRVGTPVG